MEQRDYLLREIEKIGVLLRAIFQKLLNEKDNLAITPEKQIEDEKRMLMTEMNFDVDKFLQLNIVEANEYISCFDGFNIENIELLAEYFSTIGFKTESDVSRNYLEKALQLYALCALKSKTYSLEREEKIRAIQNVL